MTTVAIDRNDLPRRALDVPRRVTLDTLADIAERSRPSMEAYREGRLPMPPEVRRRLAAFLEEYGQDILEISRELRESVEG